MYSWFFFFFYCYWFYCMDDSNFKSKYATFKNLCIASYTFFLRWPSIFFDSYIIDIRLHMQGVLTATSRNWHVHPTMAACPWTILKQANSINFLHFGLGNSEDGQFHQTDWLQNRVSKRRNYTGPLFADQDGILIIISISTTGIL